MYLYVDSFTFKKKKCDLGKNEKFEISSIKFYKWKIQLLNFGFPLKFL